MTSVGMAEQSDERRHQFESEALHYLGHPARHPRQPVGDKVETTQMTSG